MRCHCSLEQHVYICELEAVAPLPNSMIQNIQTLVSWIFWLHFCTIFAQMQHPAFYIVYHCHDNINGLGPHHIYKLGDGQSKPHTDRLVQVFHWPNPFLIVSKEVFEEPVLCFCIGGEFWNFWKVWKDKRCEEKIQESLKHRMYGCVCPMKTHIQSKQFNHEWRKLYRDLATVWWMSFLHLPQ